MTSPPPAAKIKPPRIMVAPNGARRQLCDHPRIPLTIAATAECAAACAAAGADAIHTHLRTADGAHLLDAGAYRELTAAITAAAPTLAVQITSESAGLYTPAQQRQLLYDLQPAWASLSLREHLSDNNRKEAQRLYHWAAEAGVRLQHILYSPDEVLRLHQCISDGIIPADNLPDGIEVLFVLGQYESNRDATPAMLNNFLTANNTTKRDGNTVADNFMVCAFGKNETACLIAAAQNGGDCRIGFENNLHHPDGSIAADNAERITQLRHALTQLN